MSTLHGIGAIFRNLVILVACLSSAGCSWMISRATDNYAQNLTAAFLNQNDPATIRDGIPAYLVLMDSLVEGSPENPSILSAAATLYATYGSVFAEEPERAARLTERARSYSTKAICNAYEPSCRWNGILFEDFEATLDGLGEKQSGVVYSHALASAAYIRAHSSDYVAIALLPYTEALFVRYLEINDGSDDSTVHTYLGILNTLLPPALGGNPEKGKFHFERAIELSNGQDLSAKVEYANGYARLLYERELHDRLLTEVLVADPNVSGVTLLNVLAQEQAKELLDSADDYF
ncbi:MAG: TRAP transporter TatT component family protein [Woeseiaceae bacterium]|nr:TRAP transporter TatT component family protein [Woeseiaceae bacterium]